MRKYAAALSLVLLAGCSLQPTYKRPVAAVPASWPKGEAYSEPGDAALPSLDYRDVFLDTHLEAIIEQALSNNQDLRLALSNIAAARAQYHVSLAALFPQINGSGSTTVDNASNRTRVINSAGGAGGGQGQAPGQGTQTSYSAQIGTTAFEIDLFGRLRSQSSASFAQYMATDAAARATRLTLIGEVARAYLQYAADRSLLKVATDTIANASRSVDLTRARLQGGVAPRTDLRQAETILAQARSDEASLTTSVAQDRNALELLVGAPVSDALLPTSLEGVDTALRTVPAGLDSGILLRRPDVVQAEYQLRAANARIGAARAAFFPRIALTAVAGFASTALSSLFAGDAFTWSVQPSATLPIFDAGANIGNLKYANAQRNGAIASYQKAIQTAFREVSDALARQGTIDRQLVADRQLTEAARDTLALGRARYEGGIDSYLATLDAQRSYYSAQRTLIATRLLKAQNITVLYQALGGDQSIDVRR
jgi:multidrug efflux system outer membrane protein